MHGLIGLMAATVGFAAAAAGIGHGAAAQIAQTGDLLDEIGSSGHQILKRIGHEVDLQILAYLIRTDQCHKKKKCPNSHFYVAHPEREEAEHTADKASTIAWQKDRFKRSTR